MIRSIALLLLATMVAGCGFHLRGQVPIPASLRTIHLDGSNVNGPLTRAVKQQLEASDVQLVAATDAEYTLWIEPLRERRRTVSYSGSAKSAEIQITSSAIFAIHDRAGRTVYGPRRISADRIVRNDINDVNATASETAEVERELQQQLAQLIILQYGALDPSKFVAPAPVTKQPAATP